jgi:hypothetical protein
MTASHLDVYEKFNPNLNFISKNFNYFKNMGLGFPICRNGVCWPVFRRAEESIHTAVPGRPWKTHWDVFATLFEDIDIT